MYGLYGGGLLKKDRQRRSYIAQRFNTRRKVHFASSLAAALLNAFLNGLLVITMQVD